MYRLLLTLGVFCVFVGGTSRASNSIVLSGYCDTVSNPGQSFVLYGLGQRFPAPYADGQEYTACTFAPGVPGPSVFLGEPANFHNNATVSNLSVKQTQLNGATMGGAVTIWVNPEAGGVPVQTGISCTLGPSGGGFYACTNSSNTYSIVSGDRIIAWPSDWAEY